MVDDGTPGPGADTCAGVAGVTYVHLPPTSLGAKLNHGIAAAAGDVLAKWDDDDWYGPTYLETALAALDDCPAGEGLVLWDCFLVYLARSGRLLFSGHGHKAGPTLCFERAVWEAAPFRDLPHSVDSWFLDDHGGRFRPVCGKAEELVVVRHGANTWQRFWDVDVDDYVERELTDWPRPVEDVVGAEAAAFYRTLARSGAPEPPLR